MAPKTKKYLLIAAVLVVLGIIVEPFLPEPEASGSTPVATVNNTSSSTEKKPDRTSTYVAAKAFAKRHLGSADYGFADDGFTDYGNGSYHVTGIADAPGKRTRWTVELQYNGGTPTDPSSYTEKGFVSN